MMANKTPTKDVGNERHNSDPKHIHFLLEENLKSLAYCGLWPFQSTKFLEKQKLQMSHYVAGLFLYFVFVSYLITEYVELINVWGNLENMTANMSVSCLNTVGALKIYTIFRQRQTYLKLISGISKIEENIAKYQVNEMKRILAIYVRRARRLTYFFWSLTSITITVFCIIPLIEYQYSTEYHRVYANGTEYWSYIRPMVFSSWFPFDKYAKTNYFLAYTYHVLLGLVGAAYQAIWDTFIVSMMIHSIGQLQILQYNIERITEGDSIKDVEENEDGVNKFRVGFLQLKANKIQDMTHMRLVDCVNHHRYTLRFCNDLNAIISPIMMIYFIVCSLMLCAIGFQATLYGFSIRLCLMLEYLCAMMYQLFVFYWHGNEVLHESNKLLLSSYSCGWYNQSISFKKNLFIMREGMRKPIKYSVGIFYALSLPTFLSILRASYSYFALLRQVQENKPKG